jgi:hypothetical protein
MALGWPSVDLMLEGMSAVEYNNWVARYSVEPFPEDRADMRNAQLMQAVIAASGSKKIPTIEELLPDWWQELTANQPQTPAQIQARMKLLAAMMKGKKKD